MKDDAMRTSISITAGALCGLALGIVTSACRSDLPNHCGNLSGDATCRERGQGEFCDECSLDNDGCVDAMPTVECYYPGGPPGDASSSDGSETGTATGASSGSSESGTEPTTGSTSATTGGPCAGDQDCDDAAAPYCNPAGECVTCDGAAEPDAACAGTDPDSPLCVDGACVACTAADSSVCDAALLLCDDTTNACVACTEHGQCPSGACELAVGRCFPDDMVVHVDGDGGRDFATVSAAVGSIDDGAHGVIVVHEVGADGQTPYIGLVQVDAGKIVAMLAATGEAPILQGTGANPGLRVQGGDTVLYADGLSISNGPALGLVVDGASAWVDRSRIVGNDGGGVLAQGAADITLRNCFVGGGVEVVGVEINNASAEILYSTITASTFGSTPALGCSSPVAVDIRNAIVVSQGGTSPDELDCAGAVVTNTVTEGRTGASFNAAWFEDFNGGDYRLTTGGAAPGAPIFADQAQWLSGDPTTDIEGDARPATNGATDYAGADVP